MFSDGRCPAFLLVAKGLIRWEYWNISLPEFFIKHKVICKMRSLKPILAVFCAVLAAAPLFGQDIKLETGGDRPVIGAYQGHTIAPINLTNSGRLDSLVRAGKIYLSLQDAIALALENNLDIEVQRYTPLQAESDLLRAKAGGLLRGVPQNITSGPSSAGSFLLSSGPSGGNSFSSSSTSSNANGVITQLGP